MIVAGCYFVFIFSFIFLFYTYVGYPCLIFSWSKLFPRTVKKCYWHPQVSIAVITYNEEKNIQRRIENIFSLKYPSSKREIMIVSDGSTDGTVDVVKGFSGQGVKLIAHLNHRGKAACLNDVIPLCSGEIIVFADSRQRYEKNALEELVANFSDSSIGAVSGELLFEDAPSNTVGGGIDFYWNYEKFLRKAESKVDSTVGTTGAIYAIRKTLFETIPGDTLLDDVLIPMNIVRKGYRVVFDPQAKAYDYIVKSSAQEAQRKVRTGVGNFQLFFRHGYLLNPFKNRIFFQTVSHKFLRIVAPIFILGAVISNAYLLSNLFFKSLFAFQILFYLCAAGGFVLQNKRVTWKMFSVPYAFFMLNFITVKAFVVYLLVDPRKIWRKAEG